MAKYLFTGFVLCMDIRSTISKPVSFKGYDARPLKAVVMTVCDSPKSFEIVKQVSNIGEKDGFDVYFTNKTNRLYKNLELIKNFFKPVNTVRNYMKWAQDEAVVTPKNKIIADSFNAQTGISKRISTITKGKVEESGCFIEGGNLFFVKNGKNNELFVGENELSCISKDTLKDVYGVSKVISIPQADYHLDLFIRPLKDKKVLVADDELTIKFIKNGINLIAKYKLRVKGDFEKLREADNVSANLKKLLKEFQSEIKNTQNPMADDIAKCLQENGYVPIRIPGRIYYKIPNHKKDDLVHYMNYINALVHEKSDGSLTYITNKSALNEKCGISPEFAKMVGFDFEQILIKSLEPYIKKEDIHFVSGTDNKIADLLEKESGGIHCLCNEIPKEIFE